MAQQTISKMKTVQTAVDWLVEELEKHYLKIDLKNTAAYYTAKQKEKDHIINIYKESQILMIMDKSKSAEQYYNEQYGQGSPDTNTSQSS